jgi:hypothetical protein
MPRGVRLTPEQIREREALKDAKIAERRFNFMAGIKRTYKRKTPEERALAKALKAEQMFNFTQGTFTPKPYKPRPRLTEAQKAERLFAFTQRVRAPRARSTRAPMSQAQKDARKAERQFAFMTGTSNQKPRLTPAERKARKAERQFAFTQGTYTPRPYKPRTAAQKEQTKLKKQGRALQALAETIPLPADTAFRIARPGPRGGVPRPPSIRSSLANQAM